MNDELTQSGESVAIAALQAQLAASQARIRQLEHERDTLRAAYDRTHIELELLKRRIFVAKAERVDTNQLELEFAQKLEALEALAGTLGMPTPEGGGSATNDDAGSTDGKGGKKPRGHSGGGRRDVRQLGLVEQRLELTEPSFEDLVAKGQARRIGFEESARLAWQNAGMRVLVIARAKYRTVDSEGETAIETAEMPKELLAGGLAAPSLLAHIAVAKHCDGMPLSRLEDILARHGTSVDRGTMCRWMEDLGSTLGATIVEAMRRDALRTAFCIATDATGLSIQPDRDATGQRKPCRRGHVFVQIADRDHILFTYAPRETQETVRQLFEGYKGYIQADAKNVFDILFDTGGGVEPRTEIGCWSHARRKYWEAALAKSTVAREALHRIGRIFELDATWAGRPPNDIRHLRQTLLRPHVDAFLSWAADEYKKVENVRGKLRDALGYTVRQREPLSAFLANGRLEMTNNGSERELRPIAVGRKAWLFCGSDGHAAAAMNLMTLIASAKLHKLDPERYLLEVIRLLPHWPRNRYLELSPKHWAATRARLNQQQLLDEYGPLDIPEPAPDVPDEERAAD